MLFSGWLKRRRYATNPTVATKRRRQALAVEELEPRALLAANLTLTDAFLVNRAGDAITAPVVGEMTYIRANFSTTDLTSANQYIVRFTLDGVALNSMVFTGQPGNFSSGTTQNGWFASAGQHIVSVTVDGANAVTEPNESDNTRGITFTPAAPTTLPARFVLPIGGTPFQDWSIVNYVDVDPRPGQLLDYRGNVFSYNGHNGYDITLPNFARMDAGVPVYAAAAGTVFEVEEGHFDREAAGNSNQANYVKIDHGNGWETRYLHLARNTITVRPGQVVTAGQPLGLVGSSGNSTDAHLHFSVYRDGTLVETFYDPDAYWIQPLPYQGDQETTVTDFGVTNSDPGPDIQERPSEVALFPTTYTGKVWFWYRLSHLNAGDTFEVNWYRPNGVLDSSYTAGDGTVDETQPYRAHGWHLTRTWSQYPGAWQVALEVNGQERARASFVVTPGAGEPEIRVTYGEPAGTTTTPRYLLDGRTTPVDFGTVVHGQVPQRTFTIKNEGFTNLTITNLTVPPGFALVPAPPRGGWSAVIAPGGNRTFTVELTTSQPGVRFGAIRFSSNDTDEDEFSFNVTGTMPGKPPAGSPSLSLPGPALAYMFGQAPKTLDAEATLKDSNSANFDGGSLKVEFAAGGTADDRLAIESGRFHITVWHFGQVRFNGTPIGTVSGGIHGTPLMVALNQNATVAAVQALMRSISYSNEESASGTAPRYVRFTVRDETGLVSNLPIKVVVLVPNPLLELEPDHTIKAGGLVWPWEPVMVGGPVIDPVRVRVIGLQDMGLLDAGGLLVADLLVGARRTAGPVPDDRQGIAVTTATAGAGSWQFSTDGGATWEDLGSVPAGSARLLTAGDATRIRFVPKAGFEGSLSAGLTFQVWDQQR